MQPIKVLIPVEDMTAYEKGYKRYIVLPASTAIKVGHRLELHEVKYPGEFLTGNTLSFNICYIEPFHAKFEIDDHLIISLGPLDVLDFIKLQS